MSKKTFKDIVNAVSNRTFTSKTYVERVLYALTEEISSQLCQGNTVSISGFGTFVPKKRAARTGRNPHTNKPVPIPARVVPVFNPAKNLKEMVEDGNRG